jgi:hypothetical protein
MALQYEYGQFRGKLGDKVGYRHGEKFYLRNAPPPRKKDWRKDERYTRALEVEEELKESWRWIRGIKEHSARALQKCITQARNGLFSQLIRTNITRDPNNKRGERQIQWQLLPDMLNGFEFGRYEFESQFEANCNYVELDNTPTFVCEAHDPDTKLVPPDGATHYVICAVFLRKATQKYKFISDEFMSNFLPVQGASVPRIQYSFNIPTQNIDTINSFSCLIVGVTYWVQVDGGYIKHDYGRQGVAKIINAQN